MPSDAAITDALRSLLAARGTVSVKPVGASMGAAFTRVDRLVIHRCPAAPLSRGTLVVFERNGQWIVHRVIGARKRGKEIDYVTKGDGMRWSDPLPVKHSRVEGIVVALYREGQRLSLRSPLARLVAFARAGRSLTASALKRRRRT